MAISSSGSSSSTAASVPSSNARSRLFEADIDAHICVRGVKIACAGGLGIVSSKGIVACLNIGPLHPGIGLKTNLRYEVWLFRRLQAEPLLGRNIATAAVGDVSFTVAPGETVKNLRLEGSGGAPKVLVTGPGGERLSLDADGLTQSGALVGLRSDQFGATFHRGRQGQAGSLHDHRAARLCPAGTAVGDAAGYDTSFSGSVTGRAPTSRCTTTHASAVAGRR